MNYILTRELHTKVRKGEVFLCKQFVKRKYYKRRCGQKAIIFLGAMSMAGSLLLVDLKLPVVTYWVVPSIAATLSEPNGTHRGLLGSKFTP